MFKRARFKTMDVMSLTGGVSGEYKIVVVSPDGSIKYPLGDRFHKNLILNSGLDMLFGNGQAGQGFASVFTACRAGTGNTAANIADVVLSNQVSTSTSYDALAGANSTTIDTANSRSIHKRTFNFGVAVSNINYNEVGFSNNSSSVSNLFSRVVLPATVTVLTGEILKVVYQLSCALLQTTTGSSVVLSNGGFNGAGSIRCIGAFASIFGTVNSNGSETVNQAPDFLGRLSTAWLLTNAAFPGINTALSPAYAGVSEPDSRSATAVGPYTAGTFFKDLTYVWTASVPASTVATVRSVMFNNVSNGSLWLFNTNQTKANTVSLTLVNRISWTRI